MKIFEITKPIFENVEVNNIDGLGATSWNSNIDYMGVKSTMRPSTFLTLTSDKNFVASEKNIKAITKKIEDGEKIASPFLIIRLPHDWMVKDDRNFDRVAVVTGHEGRHRMEAIRRLYGDEPVEIHLILRGEEIFEIRARHIEQEWLDQIQVSLRSQFTGEVVRSPFESMGVPKG